MPKIIDIKKIPIDKNINICDLEPQELVKLICAELGITKAQLAERLNYDPAIITRLNNEKVIKALQIYRGLYAHNYIFRDDYKMGKDNKFQQIQEKRKAEEEKIHHLNLLTAKQPSFENESNIVRYALKKLQVTYKELGECIAYERMAIGRAQREGASKQMTRALELLLENYELKKENEILRKNLAQLEQNLDQEKPKDASLFEDF
ncbi:hypothetical protein BKH43_05920 [Helicobacter sp. 13S00401-1]|uniref:hypothetical protein n=1 Tax=Helicobacter sp. 13S00401-1 TaxID=1905758 RepID=UPI000BA7C07C|nr:hypothetical protein [Helicobacter sp. 13S00401-1]PAF50144.1 hypothetical protein BKH43_05920 [Helicobacter sp. 13S00401-1]